MLNSSRSRLREANAAFARSLPAGTLLLDAGAGDSRYRDLFAHCTYECCDFQQVDKAYAQMDYVCDLRDIPVEDGRFDAVMFNQVMEHLPEPLEALRELRRVLKPGGRMIYTGPMFYEEHEQPYDFFRYTQFGLRHLFDAADLQVEQLDWMEGYFSTVAYQLHGMARHLPIWPEGVRLRRRLALAPVLLGVRAQSLALARLFHKLELEHKHTTSGYPKNYVALLRKPVA